MTKTCSRSPRRCLTGGTNSRSVRSCSVGSRPDVPGQLRGQDGGAGMKWVTRERPKTDRIACPWLIKNFIDPEAEFLYVPADQVLDVAARESAHSYDAPG